MPQPITRITAATDLSARSDRAVERAFQLAAALGVPVETLMILDDALPETLRAPMHEKAAEQLTVLCARWSGGAEYTINVQAGDPTDALVTASSAAGTLLVMGPHRPRPFLDGLRETTMQSVVRRTAAPVLLVREPVVGPYRHVLSLIDFTETADHAMALGAALAPDAPITACHAVHMPYAGALDTTGTVQLELQQKLQDDAEAEGAKWRAAQTGLTARIEGLDVRPTSPDGMVREATRGGAFDLLTAGAHGKVGAARALLGSVATDVMRNPPCDVLIGR